jgi:hypothetical protein
MDGHQRNEQSTPARAPSDTPAHLTTKTPTETFDEAEHENEQFPATERVASQEIPIWTADAINEHMSSAESDSEVDAKFDQDNDMSDLPSDIKPTLFTSHGHPNAALQHARPHDPGSGGETNTHTAPVLHYSDSDPDDGEQANTTAQSDPIISGDEMNKVTTPINPDANADEEKSSSITAPKPKTHKDFAKQKADQDWRRILGRSVGVRLRKRASDNDENIGNDVALKRFCHLAGKYVLCDSYT